MRKFHIIMILVSLIFCDFRKKESKKIIYEPDLPDKIGNWFLYSVTDSNGNTIQHYSLKVAIIRESSMPDGRLVKAWTYTKLGSTDTNFVFNNRDSAIFYDKTKSYVTDVYHFPLSVGLKWAKPYKRDTLTVVSQTSLATKFKTYTNAFLIEEHGSAPNYSFYKEQWFVPGTGMVKMYLKEFYFLSPVSQSWELTKYLLH